MAAVSDDDHRVKLEKLQDDEFSDYINASYVDVSCFRTLINYRYTFQ